MGVNCAPCGGHGSGSCQGAVQPPSYDCQVVIIGGGPAGYSTAIYTARAELTTLILEGPAPGGQLTMTDVIENYPGIAEPVAGYELAENMRAQAVRFGARSMYASAVALSKTHNGLIAVELDTGETVHARAAVVAVGALPRRLNVPGEARLLGKGVSYCATCDGPFFRNKSVVVVGGGDAALKEAVYLSKIASGVKIVHRREFLRAEKVVQRAALTNNKIEFLYYWVVDEILGDGAVTGVRIKNVQTGELRVLDAEGIFVFAGTIPGTSFLAGSGILDGDGWIPTNRAMETSLPGVFAVGDVRANQLRQVATAVGDGVIAADSVQKYLDR